MSALFLASAWVLAESERVLVLLCSSLLLSLSPGHQELLYTFHCRCEFVLLDGSCGIDVLRANLRTLANERASPNAFRMGENRHALFRSLIAGVFVVALSQRQRRRAEEYRIKS